MTPAPVIAIFPSGSVAKTPYGPKNQNLLPLWRCGVERGLRPAKSRRLESRPFISEDIDAPKSTDSFLRVSVPHQRFVATCRSFTRSRGGAVVVVQHATQALAPLDASRGHKATRLWNDQPIAQPLVIALRVVMGDKVVNNCPQRLLSKQDHPLQARFLDRPQESLGVGIQIR
jgi:hypothetical protein